jgi:hypothetical protein
MYHPVDVSDRLSSYVHSVRTREGVVMKKLIGVVLTAGLTLSPASAAFAGSANEGNRHSQTRRQSSCTVDAGVLTRAVDAQVFCGNERSAQRRGQDGQDRRRSSRQSSCTVDLGVLTRTVNAQVFCGRERANRERSAQRRRQDSRSSRRSSCTVDLGVLTRTVNARVLCPSD